MIVQKHIKLMTAPFYSVEKMSHIEQAKLLINQALDLLQGQSPVIQSAGQSPSRNKLTIPSEQEALLKQWIHVHCAQWRQYWQVHHSEPSNDHDLLVVESLGLLPSVFLKSLERGHTDVAKWILRTQNKAVFSSANFFRVTPSPTAVLKLLKECHHGPTPANNTPIDDYIVDCLKWASENGVMTLLILLSDSFVVTTAHVQSDQNEALHLASQYGHADVLRFLKQTWNLTDKDARCRANEALVSAAKGGHVEAIKVLKEDYGLTYNDARDCFNNVLHEAAAHGHVNVLQFLKDSWGFTAADARSHTNYALRIAAKRGHVSVLKYLKDAWDLTIDDAQAIDNEALIQAIRNGHKDVQQFFKDTWDLSLRDALLSAVKSGKLVSLKHFKDAGIVTKSDIATSEIMQTAVRGGHQETILFLTNWAYGQ